jgi:hypothetical protein
MAVDGMSDIALFIKPQSAPVAQFAPVFGEKCGVNGVFRVYAHKLLSSMHRTNTIPATRGGRSNDLRKGSVERNGFFLAGADLLQLL